MVELMERQTASKELFPAKRRSSISMSSSYASAMRMTHRKEAAEDLLSEVYAEGLEVV